MPARTRNRLARGAAVTAALALLCACNRSSGERRRSASPVGDGVVDPAAREQSATATAAVTGPDEPASPRPKLHASLTKQPDGLRLSLQNRDTGPVSLKAHATASGPAGPLVIPLAESCPKQIESDACRPLSPGAELWLTPLQVANAGKCEALPTATQVLEISTCSGEHTFKIEPSGE